MNKKSNLTDFLTAGSIFLGLCIVTFVMFTILDGFGDGIDAAGVANDTSVVDLPAFIDSSNNKMATSVDWGILVFAILAMVFSYIAATKVPTNNKMIILLSLIVFIFFIISMVISNVFGTMMTNATFSNYINLHMPLSKLLLKYFPFYSLIYCFVVFVGFFGKREGSL